MIVIIVDRFEDKDLITRLPFFLYSVVQTVSSAGVIGPASSGPTMTVSEKITATWSLDARDSTLSQGFSMVLVNDAADEAIEWSTTVNPSGKSIGTIHPIPTATGYAPKRCSVIIPLCQIV